MQQKNVKKYYTKYKKNSIILKLLMWFKSITFKIFGNLLLAAEATCSIIIFAF